LIREPFDVLMEAAPAGLDVEAVGGAICREEGVRSVHDLHVWTVTAGFGAIAAHVVVARDSDRDLIRRRLELTLGERFGIEHTTLQMEEEADEGLLRVENAPGES
jgi:cobalt-zinc-cadmium efflux system protein